MQLRRVLPFAIPVLLLALFAAHRVATADERHVRRAFRELAELAEKRSAAENPVLAALDAGRLAKLVDERIELTAPELRGRSWTETRDDLVRHAFAVKARAARLSLSFDDLQIRFPAPDRAVATGEATLSGDLPDFGGAFGDTREVSVTFRRDPSSGAWLVVRAAAVPVAVK